MKQILVLTLLTIALTLPQASHSEGVRMIEPEELPSLLSSSPLLLVLFTDPACPNCLECASSFALAQQHRSSAQFVQLALSPSTRTTFDQYQLLDLPRVLAFKSGQLQPQDFPCLGTGSNVRFQLLKWIDRLDNSLPEWAGQEDHEHQLIVHCDSPALRHTWKLIERSELWLDVYCGGEDFLGNHLAVIAEFGKSIEAWQLLSQDPDTLQHQLSRLIRAYKYKYVLNWNTATAQEVFINRQPAFLLLANNESQSLQATAYFQQLKQHWYEHTDSYEPTLFALSDLPTNTYETIRLKRYLTGIATSAKNDYFYPLIAFLQPTPNRTRKFILLRPPQQKQQLQHWMQTIHDHVILGNSYAEGQEELHEWFSEDLLEKSKQEGETKVRQLQRLEEWYTLLSTNHSAPFFVYFSWRYDYQLQKLEAELTSWWQDKEETPLYIHPLHALDLPLHPGITLQHLPSFCFVNPHKQVYILHGVTQLDKIKAFAKQHMDPASIPVPMEPI